MKFLAQVQLLLQDAMHLLLRKLGSYAWGEDGKLGRYAWGEDDQPKSTQIFSISTFDGFAVFCWNQPAVVCHTLTVGVMVGAGGAAGQTGIHSLGQKETISS